MVRDDGRLLRQYIEQNSQAAFGELTGRYLRLVYGTCLRELHDATLAEDATQVVFLILARKAASLRSHAALASWLFTTARVTARQIQKQERLRQNREQKAFSLGMETNGESLAWSQIVDQVNDGVATLSPEDREAVLLRFFDGLNLKEVGEALGIPENTARMRVTRSVDKLRAKFARDGVMASADALSALLASEAARALPLAPPAVVTQRVFEALVPAGHSSVPSAHLLSKTAEGVIRHMTIKKLQVAAMVAGLGILGICAFTSHAASVETGKAWQPAVIGPSTVKVSLTGVQILQKCQDAYYSVTTLDENVQAYANGNLQGTAHIQYQSPDKLRVNGQTMFPGQSYDLVCDGKTTSVYAALQWGTEASPAAAIDSITGISANTGTLVPAILVHDTARDLSNRIKSTPMTVTAEMINGQDAYCVTCSNSRKDTYWINCKTFFLIQWSWHPKYGSLVVSYDAPVINKPIPATTFVHN